MSEIVIRRSGIQGPGSDVLQPLVDDAQAAAEAAEIAASQALSTAGTQSVHPLNRAWVNPEGIGYEVYGDGSIQPQANSEVSLPIPIAYSQGVYLRGFSGSGDTGTRLYRWLDSAGTYIADTVGSFPGSSIYVPKPKDAYFFQFSARQRQASEPSDWREKIFVRTDYAGRRILLFGDSITEGPDVDNGSIIWPGPSGGGWPRHNWEYYAMPMLEPSIVYCYAKSGAHFASVGGLTTYQKLLEQVLAAVNNADLIGTIDAIIVAIGTNDISHALDGSLTYGTCAATMAKSYGALDPTISMDAYRMAIISMETRWPTVRKFYSTPIQRGDTLTISGVPNTVVTPELMSPYVDEAMKLSSRYNFKNIDCFRNCGIISDFERGTDHRDLYDGLHPGDLPTYGGQFKQGRYIGEEVRTMLW